MEKSCPSIGNFNSLVPDRCGCNLKLGIFKFTSKVNILSISCEIALRWMPQEFTDDKSTLVQVMAWCHHLDQCWPRSISPYGVARPQWVNEWGKIGYNRELCCSTIENVANLTNSTMHQTNIPQCRNFNQYNTYILSWLLHTIILFISYTIKWLYFRNVDMLLYV